MLWQADGHWCCVSLTSSLERAHVHRWQVKRGSGLPCCECLRACSVPASGQMSTLLLRSSEPASPAAIAGKRLLPSSSRCSTWVGDRLHHSSRWGIDMLKPTMLCSLTACSLCMHLLDHLLCRCRSRHFVNCCPSVWLPPAEGRLVVTGSATACRGQAQCAGLHSPGGGVQPRRAARGRHGRPASHGRRRRAARCARLQWRPGNLCCRSALADSKRPNHLQAVSPCLQCWRASNTARIVPQNIFSEAEHVVSRVCCLQHG